MPMERTLTWIMQLTPQFLALLTAAFGAASLLGLGMGRVYNCLRNRWRATASPSRRLGMPSPGASGSS